ncbi:hypothetical protein [Rubrolithibacter danxiaensis]|uniref:hypothetical protein n=1 Tax=Rubrolithibacter danxiaensis TaxID=3390805 RepID=UPI003BF8985C
MTNDDKDINNQSDKPEKFEPKDSERKEIKHHQDDEETVLKDKDKDYQKENPEFYDPQKRKVEREQPITPIDEKPGNT